MQRLNGLLFISLAYFGLVYGCLQRADSFVIYF